MGQRVIACQVVNEYVQGDGVVVGAVGSHNEVLIELDFSSADSVWDGTTKTVTFTDAMGQNPVNILLTTNLLADGQDKVYLVPVPQAAKAVAGMMGMSVSGVVTENGNEVLRASTELAKFRVLPSETVRWTGETDIPASVADQIQAEMDALIPDIAIIAAALDDVDIEILPDDLDRFYLHTQNSAIHVTPEKKTYWDGKQDALTYDQTPTQGSQNALTSGAVYQSIQQNTAVDEVLSGSSVHPVQNKAIYTALQNIYTSLDGKQPKASGKGLSTNDYTTTEKNKLAGIAASAEVNQNAFANVKVGSTTVAADAKQDTLELVAGSNVTITPDATNDKVTIAATDTTYSSKTAASGGTAVSLVTTGEKYTWNNKQNALTFDNSPVSGSSNPVKSSGIYSALAGKQATLTFDSTPTAGSNNPVKSGGIKTALDGKAAASHTHAADDIASGILPVERGGTGNSTGYVTAGKKSGTTLGANATAEGTNNVSSGECCHSEGYDAWATGKYCHAEGMGTEAAADYSHAEGGHTKTRSGAQFSHVEGVNTVANGENCHVEGYETIGNGDTQHVFGQYNVADTSSVEIVGWGTSAKRKNIRTLDQSGNMTIAGTLTQSSDARLKDVHGEVPDVSGIRAVRFRWNDTRGEHDEKDHIGYIAQEVEKLAPFLVGDDSNGYKSLDYIALLCAKVEMLERRVAELEGGR